MNCGCYSSLAELLPNEKLAELFFKNNTEIEIEKRLIYAPATLTNSDLHLKPTLAIIIS
jgi:hypothetical protein